MQVVLAALASEGVLASSMGGRLLRFVTHLDVGDADVARAVTALSKVASQLTAAA